MHTCTKEECEKLAKYGFKWYINQCTDRVEPDLIETVVPSVGGLTVIYKDCFLAMSTAIIEKIEWRDDPNKEWIYVHLIKIQDEKNPNFKVDKS